MAGEMRIRRGRRFSRRMLDAAGAGLEGLGVITRLSSGALTEKFLLVKYGADANHVALCGSADSPLATLSLSVGADIPSNVSRR